MSLAHCWYSLPSVVGNMCMDTIDFIVLNRGMVVQIVSFEDNMNEMHQVWSMCHALGFFNSSKPCSTFWKTVVLPHNRCAEGIDQ